MLVARIKCHHVEKHRRKWDAMGGVVMAKSILEEVAFEMCHKRIRDFAKAEAVEILALGQWHLNNCRI